MRAPFGLVTLILDRRVGTGWLEEIGPLIVVAVRREQAAATPDFNRVSCDVETSCEVCTMRGLVTQVQGRVPEHRPRSERGDNDHAAPLDPLRQRTVENSAGDRVDIVDRGDDPAMVVSDTYRGANAQVVG